ncbi:RluA family pseudouridine synthase [Aquirufa nivalisilvae]|uniref:RluA family pseudouridine synthase n=1 Tax=Aquirufa nivalisilvae TaxID=2516557 RepID=UPI0022A9EBDB|nr:RluA family pseudouridine synthase [Aquirufa nivalisilvae]MCZ2480268.1 RluA family pseudouridine synthase [Aquirufa nivalisilvae]MCZ2482337.1 RluA family pseudouridine synthase [Aquirufa nivalisilvae]
MSIDNEIDPIESEDDLFEHFNFTVDKGQQLLRIDKYLLLKISNATRSKIQSGIEAGSVKVNGLNIKSNYKVKPFDEIVVSFSHPPRDKDIIAENIPLDIIYEDEELILVNKPSGMVVHPAHGNWEGTLVNALLYHCQHLPGKGDIRPGLVHRIDKDTSGILVVAKSEFSLNHLARQFFDHTIDRTYYAICWGVPKESKATLRGKIDRSPRDRKVMMMFPEEAEHGKLAITHYEVMESFVFCSLVRFNLETGRTHQIRAHAASIGHPLLSDAAYGGDKIRYMSSIANFKTFAANLMKLCPRQALHAFSLGFDHPKANERIYFEQDFPEDMREVLYRLREVTNHGANRN